MNAPAAHASASARLIHAIEHAAHLLPAQGPITVFIHHNTLHAFEDEHFETAVQRGGATFGCEPFLSEERFRAELRKGRIRLSDLQAVLKDELQQSANESIFGLVSRLDFRLTMLQGPIWSADEAELDYFLAEDDALKRIRSDISEATRSRVIAETRRWVMRDLRSRVNGNMPSWAKTMFARSGISNIENWNEKTWEAFAVESLWHICLAGLQHAEPIVVPPAKPLRHRDALLAATSVDADPMVNEFLTRFCAAFLDQGISAWPLPNKPQGFYRAFLELYSRAFGPPDSWLRPLRAEAARILKNNIEPMKCIEEALQLLGVEEAEWDDFFASTFLSLRGWAGMVHEVEMRKDRIAHPIPGGTLIEYIAVRLLLDRLAVASVASAELGYSGPLAELRSHLQSLNPKPKPQQLHQRAFPIFQLVQLLGWSPEELATLTPQQWHTLVGEVEAFHGIERRLVFQLAYERRFRTQTLDIIAAHKPYRLPAGTRPRFQMMACLDEREESFRRHLEEVAPDTETFGAAGFFNVVMFYRGAADAHFVPLCPIVLTPERWVQEQVCEEHTEDHLRRSRHRQRLGAVSHKLQRASHSATIGAALTACVGVLASVFLVARILFPRLTGKFRNRLQETIRTPTATQLQLERTQPQAGSEGNALGYTIDEMAIAAERLLRDIGLLSNFSRLVFILGHGSNSMNNPHKSAYDCGACGGSPGAANGRALAQMLNDPRVRNKIITNGIAIPEDTWFVGGFHNTCDDSVTLADQQLVPATHRDELARAISDFAETCDRNAHERSRRFMSAPLNHGTRDARQHVENRSEDLAQVRPELGHATNAICIVARRERTQGIYFDRRAFLTSYDPTQDDAEGSTLARLLGAAVPVCGGINLEYYFSHVDSRGYGCSTKLPHNVTGLLGVMDGAASDLRTGLPWQMVEIHEPIRLLFVIESTPEIMFKVMSRNAMVDTLIRNGWVQVSVLDPHSQAIQVFQNGAFVPYEPSSHSVPSAASSIDWYRGWRDHLEFAEIVNKG